MVAKGDMLYAWTTSSELADVAECACGDRLLKFALENNIVDGVLASRRC